MSKIIAGEPSAWELRVRRADTEWRRYSIYEKYEHAANTMKRVEGLVFCNNSRLEDYEEFDIPNAA